METKEQLKQRIAELEAKIKQVAEEFNKQHELLDQYELNCTDEIIRLKNRRIAELQEENAKLTEQLKNSIQDIQNFIERKITASKKASQEYIDGYCACGCNINDYIEDKVKAEAQKYLEEHNG